MHLERRVFAIGVALMAALTLGGCVSEVSYQDAQNALIRPASRPWVAPTPSKHKENYLQVRGKGKEEPRFGFVRTGYELFAPFRLGVTMGGFDAKLVEYSLDQQGCVELDVPNSNPLQFAAFCGFKTSATNWAMTVGYNLGGSSNQSAFVNFNDAGDRIRMKIEADDESELRFYAKTTVAIDWTLVSTIDADDLGFDLTEESLVPGYGGSRLNKNGEIGFANFWATRAPRPDPSDEQRVLDYTLEGIKFNLKGIQRLDDESPDESDALDNLDSARSNYQMAYAYIDLNLPMTDDNDDALAYLGKSIQFTDKALDLTFDGKYKAAWKQSQKAADWGNRAAEIYFDLNLDF